MVMFTGGVATLVPEMPRNNTLLLAAVAVPGPTTWGPSDMVTQ